MSSSPFQIHTEFNGKLTRVYIGNKTTIWFSYETPVAFAISGYGTFTLDPQGQTATTRKHINSIPAKASLPADEFYARLATLGIALDDEAGRMIERPSWDDAEATKRTIETAARRNGWEI